MASVKRVRITEQGAFQGDHSVKISGLTRQEAERMEGMTFGQYHVTIEGGEPIFTHTREPLPDPVADEEMLPFWRRYEHGPNTPIQTEMYGKGLEKYQSPHFTIQHLCGYYYTPERYREEATRLESYGFTHMRSKRGEDGCYWEMWYLPGAWASEGALKDALEQARSTHKKAMGVQKETEFVTTFLSRNASFGTLDVSVQRLAMPNPE